MFELLEIADLFLSWRFFVGLLTTGLICLLSYSVLEPSALAVPVTVVLGLTGIILSFRWQARADAG
jgi:hypothetical protein